MSKEVAGRRSITFGKVELPIVEPVRVHTVVADIITEAWDVGNGSFALTLATFEKTGDKGVVEAVVTARLRLSYSLLSDLKTTIESAMASAAPSKEKAN